MYHVGVYPMRYIYEGYFIPYTLYSIAPIFLEDIFSFRRSFFSNFIILT